MLYKFYFIRCFLKVARVECIRGAATASSTAQPHIPLSATALQVLHLLLSATFVFLFLLAVKNRFKIE